MQDWYWIEDDVELTDASPHDESRYLGTLTSKEFQKAVGLWAALRIEGFYVDLFADLRLRYVETCRLLSAIELSGVENNVVVEQVKSMVEAAVRRGAGLSIPRV